MRTLLKKLKLFQQKPMEHLFGFLYFGTDTFPKSIIQIVYKYRNVIYISADFEES